MSTCASCGGTVNRIKVEVNIDNRDKATQDSQTDSKSIAKPEIKVEPKIDVKSASDPNIDVAPIVKSTVSPKTDTTITSEVEAKSKSKAKAKSKVKVKESNSNEDEYDSETMTICHVTPSGQRNTLVLPTVAALAHLENHPEDTEGPCESLEISKLKSVVKSKAKTKDD